MAHKGFFQKKNKHIAHKASDEKSKHIKGFGCRQGKIKHMTKHTKGFNMSKIKHMRKNQGFSDINSKTMLLKQLVYTIHIFSVLEKIPID